MDMKYFNIKNSIITLVLSFCLFKGIYASDALNNLEKDIFFETADRMMFKDLREIASTSRLLKEKVKEYFAYKKEPVVNAIFPIINREVLSSYRDATGSLPQGLPSYIPEQRILPGLKSNILHINGVKWQYMTHYNEEGPQEELMTGDTGFFGDADSAVKYGNMTVKSRIYNIEDGRRFRLSIFHEELKLD